MEYTTSLVFVSFQEKMYQTCVRYLNRESANF